MSRWGLLSFPDPQDFVFYWLPLLVSDPWVILAYLSPQVGNFQVSLTVKFLTVPRLRLVQHHPCSGID